MQASIPDKQEHSSNIYQENDFWYSRYSSAGFNALKCKGYHLSFNPEKIYKTSKESITKGYTGADYKSLTKPEHDTWIRQGGWVGWVIPPGLIALDIEDDDSINYIQALCAQRGLSPGIHITNNGKHYLFRCDVNLSASTDEYTKAGFINTYRVGGKSYLILAPTNDRRWERWVDPAELPSLPLELYPYDNGAKGDLLNVLSWELGQLYKDGVLHGFDDLDTAYMGYLIENNLSVDQVHQAFTLLFRRAYDYKRTEDMYIRTAERFKTGSAIRGAGSLIQKLKEFDLKVTLGLIQRISPPNKGMKDTPNQDKKGAPITRTPIIVELNTIQPEVVQWLWQGYIPLGKVTLIDGDPGLGKSIFTLDIAARTSKGVPMPDGSTGIKGGAVLLTLEDGLADTVVPRLTSLGADLSMVIALQAIAYPDGTSSFPTVRDTDVIEMACRKVSAKLLIVDPLMGYLGSEVNSYRDQDIRQALSPLSHLAEKLGIAIIVIRHLNKNGGNQSIYRGGGSIGIIGAARCAYLIAKDPQDENRRVMACIKNNLAPLPTSLSFQIEGLGNSSRIVWGGVSSHSADALLAIPVSEEERTALDEAKDFLLEILSDGPVDSKDIQTKVKTAGIAERTLQRAKKMLNVKSRKSDFKSGWIWTLAEDCQDKPKTAIKNNGNLGGDLATFADTEVIEVEGEQC